MGRSRKSFWIGTLSVLLLTGCGSSKQEVVAVDRAPYEKLSYETTEVKRGDLEPEITLKLKEEGYEKINYKETNPELQLDTVHVKVGAHVEKGDVLVSFHSESIQSTIDSYEEQINQNQLLIDHYTRLMQIDDSVDYGPDIARMQSDMEVAALYIAEAEEKLARYQIVAEQAGTITEMNSYLQSGIYEPGNLITEICGTGNYEAKLPEGYEFQVGERYMAEVGINTCELEVSEVTEETVIFTPVSDMSSVMAGQDLSMTIKQEALHDAVYVKASAVEEVDDNYFVYVLDENGYREAVPVTIGERVGEYRLITEGLSGGEKVTLR